MKNTASRRVGRPSKKPETDIYSKPLYVLLKDKLPSEFVGSDGRINTETLSKRLGYRRFTIYRWLNGERMSVEAAKRLAALSDLTKEEAKKGAITKEMLMSYCGL